MSEEQTHYRKAFNSPYLSSADITEPTKLTIKHVKLEPDKSKKTKDNFNTAYFVEKEIRKGEELKPMILNAGNSGVIKNFVRSPYLEKWVNVPITVYVDPNVRFGRETVEGLRISSEQPSADKTELKPDTKLWTNAVIAYKRDDNFDKIEIKMYISDENKAKIKKEALL